ncbi:MAG: hypothetical protein ACREMJ_02560 [Gemmatimonadales bacterium]
MRAAAPLLVCAAAAAATGRAQAPPIDTAAAQRFWVRPVASLMLPGTGQFLSGQDRGAIYVGAELLVLLRYFQYDREGERSAERFRRLAFEAARSQFVLQRRDTVFEYYEQMQRFTDSGEFDRDPGPPLVPEDDPATYNGSVWLLARRTFWADPDVPPDPASLEYQRALELYRTRAVGPDFRWSWRGAALEHEVFRETIHQSDRAFRRAQVQLGLLLANHVVSAVDAFISSRLQAATGRPTELRSSVDAHGRATLRLRVAF